MTSEILILTPSAVALAADSAVTIGNRKTYNGVNKLFMLSNDPPMGIMTYNLSDFSNIPLETIIKEFRKYIKNESFQLNNVTEFKNKFKEFLEKIVDDEFYTYSFEDKLNGFTNPLIENLGDIDKNDFLNALNSIPTDWGYDIFEEFSEDIIKNLDSYDEKFIDAIPDYDQWENKEEILNKFKRFFVFNEFITSFTGIVIAGFNKNRLFPSYIEFNINYLYDDNFILKDVKQLDIVGNLVHVRPLAQDDVINTFLTSIDKDTELELTSYVYKFYEDYTNKLKEAINSNSNLNADEKIKFLNEVSKIESVNDDLGKLFEKVINQLKDNHSNHLLESISVLPKEELSNLAESLINITSLKRKVDSNLETVGGDIDVAIITKGDGFIWTKRKHYFDADLNPQFFKRD